MPTMPVRNTAKAGISTGKPTSYVKFSDKLTQSIDDIQKIIESHKQMIDSIQEVALELTSSIGTLHTLTVKYARTANQILDVLLPIIKSVPLIPKNVTQMLTNLEALTQKIIDNEASTSKTITDVRGGLQTGDVNKLKAHAGQLQNVTRTITSIIPKG
ncbi:MAG: hypothetical protein UZ14_CFX002002945 [Chloroflexi bacterium OLB14]|nr:MAG: hypothetical protein UZ14_CFX002002945 [Chloroflexi bacterium OLB14]